MISDSRDRDIDVGKNVRRIRLKRGMTQESLALLMGTSPANIGRIERGKQAPTTETLIKLAYCLEADVAEFFEEEKENEQSGYLPDRTPARR